MISYQAYKVIHLAGLFMLLISLGGAALSQTGQPTLKRLVAWTNGAGLLVALVGGFGLIARLGLTWPWDGWVFVKLVIWIVLALMLTLLRKRPERIPLLWWASVGLAVTGAYLANYKPF